MDYYSKAYPIFGRIKGYYTERPHKSLGLKSPIEYLKEKWENVAIVFNLYKYLTFFLNLTILLWISNFPIFNISILTFYPKVCQDNFFLCWNFSEKQKINPQIKTFSIFWNTTPFLFSSCFFIPIILSSYFI